MSSDATTLRACTCGAELPPEGARCAQCGKVHQPALVLGGKWRVERRLGAGGMGAVYLAVDLALGRHVAVKVLHPNLVDDKSFVARFQREARVLARLDHPSIVPVYACETAPEGVLLVMKHIEGPTLSVYLKTRGRLSPTETAVLLKPLASAVGALHRHGLVHRDLKPSNVIVQADFNLVLLDFGLARHSKDTDRLTTPGSAVGSGPYMAPEQARDEAIDHRTDLYAVAVIAFQCLTGEVPFAKDGPAALFKRISTPPPLASSLVPTLGDALSAVVGRGMALKREDRFDSVEAFVQAFTVAAHQPSGAPDDDTRTQRATLDGYLAPKGKKT